MILSSTSPYALLKSFQLLVVSNTTPFFAFVQIIYFLDCRQLAIPRKNFQRWSKQTEAFKSASLTPGIKVGRKEGLDSQNLNIHYLNLLYWTTSKKREVNGALSLVSRYVESR